ncbi:hypothetical protein L218DRAFT_991212 [Marasmius fiardii PR-910]|nr:hypothetical protein L218DRAFT_991212 [Marasmius fiardii PR-910]
MSSASGTVESRTVETIAMMCEVELTKSEGFFTCLYGLALLIYCLSPVENSARSKGFIVMLHVSTIMFILATVHLCATYQMVIEGKGYLGSYGTWYNSLSTVVFVTQEILGNGVAIYRTWIIWNRSWKIITIPTLLLLCEIVTGYIPCIIPAIVSAFELAAHHIKNSLIAFSFITVFLNFASTSLSVYPLWRSHQRTSRLRRTNAVGRVRTHRGTFFQIIRIMIESAALQAIVDVTALSAQFIFYCITATFVGITFTLITLRMKAAGSQALPLVKEQSPVGLSVFSAEENQFGGYRESGGTTWGGIGHTYINVMEPA